MQATIIPHPATQKLERPPAYRIVLPNDFEITGSIQTSPFKNFIQMKQATLYRQGKRLRQDTTFHICTHAILYIVEE
jgi:hypothetical protein